MSLAWNPNKAGVLATGGGEGDNIIRLWDVNHEIPVHAIRCTAPVTSLAWSKSNDKDVDDLVSTHGDPENGLKVWQIDHLKEEQADRYWFTKVKDLNRDDTRHEYNRVRQPVITNAISPDGSLIATCSEDETVCLWKVFPPIYEAKKPPVTLDVK